MVNKLWTKWQEWPKNVITQIFQSLYNFISTLERNGETAKLSQMVSFTMNNINHKIELKGFKEKDAWFELKTTSTNEIVDGFLVRFDLIR